MIARQRLNWFRMLFVWRGSVLKSILAQLLVVLAISTIVTLMRGQIFGRRVPLTMAELAPLGVSLAIFLGFRNNASYDRFWEGRKLWGNLLNVTRSLVRQALSMAKLEKDDPRLEEWVSLLLAFTHGLRHQLRRSDPTEDYQRLLPRDVQSVLAGARFRPAVILTFLGEWVVSREREGMYGEITTAAIDRNLSELSNVLGGCERLESTPLPYPYSVMIHRTVYAYCFLLPFGLVATIGAMTPVVSVLTAYTFMALEALAEEIEEPFGVRPNDLALEDLSIGIEHTLIEMIGRPIPSRPSPPRHFVLH